jgi:hypothetical protein
MKPTGIDPRHARSCAKTRNRDARCNCRPSFAAWIYDPRTRKKVKQSFPTQAAAKKWRRDASVAIAAGTLRGERSPLLRDAASAWLEGARSGAIRTRSGDEYKPSAVRGYEQAFRLHLLPDLGPYRIADVQRRDVQGIVDRMLAAGCNPSTIRNAVIPLRALYPARSRTAT